MANLGRLLMVAGLILLATGALFYLLGRLGLDWSHVPGNIRIERGNFTCIFGLGISILLSIVLTVGLNLLARWLNK
jgi:hypothetical protein